MTAILPQIGQTPSIRSGPADEARADPPPRTDFKSLLDQVGTDSDQNGRGMSASEFDAFGFFGSAGAPPVEGTDPPGNREGSRAPRAGETLSTPAGSADAPEQPAATDEGTPAEHAAAASDTPAGEAGGSADRGPVAARSSALRADGAGVGAAPETLPAAGVPGHQSAPPVTQGENPPEDVPVASRAGAAPGRQSADRLVLSLSGKAIELIGRLPGLGEDDERRLLNALGELLESYGLILGSAHINGRPVAGARTGKGDS